MLYKNKSMYGRGEGMKKRDRGRRLFWQALAAGAVMILLGICLAKDHSLKHPVFLTVNREILAYPFGEETHPLWAYRPFRVYYVQDRWTKKRSGPLNFRSWRDSERIASWTEDKKRIRSFQTRVPCGTEVFISFSRSPEKFLSGPKRCRGKG